MIDLGKLSEPATKLVEKVSDAVEGLAKPWQIQRVAKAEAVKKVIDAEADVEVAALKRRAVERWLNEEAKEQRNIEAITAQSILLLTEAASPEKLSEDWVANFFKASRTISEPEMQALWARILAGEANNPGAVSKRTVNVLSQLGTEDAKAFEKLAQRVCRFDRTQGILRKLMYGAYPQPEFEPEWIPEKRLLILESFGLVSVGGFGSVTVANEQIEIKYFDKKIATKRPVGALFFDKFQLEVPGQELFAIGLFKPDEVFWAKLVAFIEKIQASSEPSISKVSDQS
jgi:hypothetical protein